MRVGVAFDGWGNKGQPTNADGTAGKSNAASSFHRTAVPLLLPPPPPPPLGLLHQLRA